MKDYYQNPDSNYFDWIQIHTWSEDFQKHFPGDHAGQFETSDVMEIHPELVHLEKLAAKDWFAENAVNATREYGRKHLDASVDELEKILGLA